MTLASGRGSPTLKRWLQVQLGGEAALLRAGRVRHVLSLPASRGVAPHVVSVLPIAVEAGADFELTVTGSNIADEDAQLLCRQDGASGGGSCSCSVLLDGNCKQCAMRSTADDKG